MRGHNPSTAMKLSRAALVFRAAHAAIALEMLLAIAYVWWCALSGRRAPQNGLCRRWVPSPLPGLSSWWYVVAETLVRR